MQTKPRKNLNRQGSNEGGGSTEEEQVDPNYDQDGRSRAQSAYIKPKNNFMQIQDMMEQIGAPVIHYDRNSSTHLPIEEDKSDQQTNQSEVGINKSLVDQQTGGSVAGNIVIVKEPSLPKYEPGIGLNSISEVLDSRLSNNEEDDMMFMQQMMAHGRANRGLSMKDSAQKHRASQKQPYMQPISEEC